MSAAPVLVALLGGRVVGHVEQNLQGRLRFTYDQTWRDWPGAYPLSLSMPIGRREHEDDRIRPYLEGLLPDNDWILRRWGSQFHVSARNPFTLLAHVGDAAAEVHCAIDPAAHLRARDRHRIGGHWQRRRVLSPRRGRRDDDQAGGDPVTSAHDGGPHCRRKVEPAGWFDPWMAA